MRSMDGVGMTPPNVLGTPKPASSVMMSSTLGASLGGMTRGAHQGFDSSAASLITPPNFGSGGGSCFPSIWMVALGEPGSPVMCCAIVGAAPSRALAIVIHNTIIVVIVFMSLLLLLPVYPRRRGARDLVTIGCVMGSPRASLWASAGPMKRW